MVEFGKGLEVPWGVSVTNGSPLPSLVIIYIYIYVFF